MPHIQGELGQIDLDIGAFFVPTQKCAYSETVTEVLEARAMTIAITDSRSQKYRLNCPVESTQGVGITSNGNDEWSAISTIDPSPPTEFQIFPQFLTHALGKRNPP